MDLYLTAVEKRAQKQGMFFLGCRRSRIHSIHFPIRRRGSHPDAYRAFTSITNREQLGELTSLQYRGLALIVGKYVRRYFPREYEIELPEAVSRTWERLMRCFDREKSKVGSIVPITYLIAKQTCMCMKRERRRAISLGDLAEPADGREVIDDVLERERLRIDAVNRDSLEEGLALLRPDDARLLRLRLEGMSYKEIAPSFGITPNALKVRAMRARIMLRRIVKNLENGTSQRLSA